MKVVVFGGSGFLGSHVSDCLRQVGLDVFIYDCRASDYLLPEQKMIQGDILDQVRVSETVNGSDVVYNFAGISDIDEASKKPLDSVKLNILGNAIILEACRKAGVKRFVFASSLYVYSKAGSFYRSTKQACELVTENYREMFGLNYTILRYGSLYGPRSNQNNYIYALIKQALIEGKITREGDGEEIREYIHVQDASRCSVEILGDEFANQYVVITGNQQTKIKDLFIMVREILDNKIRIEYKPPMSDIHYEITPYTFSPKIAKRLVSKTYLDFGQGLLKQIQDIYGDLSHSTRYNGLMVDK